jgi:hypothetical protein
MSGCVHCVYTIYAEELETYTQAMIDARAALTKSKIPRESWPEDVREKSEEEVEKVKVEEGLDLDPTLAAFLAYVAVVPLESMD